MQHDESRVHHVIGSPLHDFLLWKPVTWKGMTLQRGQEHLGELLKSHRALSGHKTKHHPEHKSL